MDGGKKKKKGKVIAIDYDQTITADPTLMKGFIKDARKRGHRVVIATMRFPEDMTDELRVAAKLANKLVFTCKKAKRKFLEDMGIFPDMWIDDKPEYILKNKTTPVRGRKGT